MKGVQRNRLSMSVALSSHLTCTYLEKCECSQQNGTFLLNRAPSFISPRFIFPLTKASFHSCHSFRAHSTTEKQVRLCAALLLTSVASLIGFLSYVCQVLKFYMTLTLASARSWQCTRQIKIKRHLLTVRTEVLISEITCSRNRHFLFKSVRAKLWLVS